MYKKCKYCNTTFNGTGNFCSDMCEIKNHASEVVPYETYTISPEIKEEVLPETPILADKITENKERSIQVEADLEISKVKPDKFRSNQSI